MKLVIPMAGLGTRMRPHTWARPKSLLPLAGRPILEHILERFGVQAIEQYVFVVGWLGEQIRSYVTEHCDVPTAFVTQDKMLGQAHAIWLAREHLVGPLFLMWVDTLFDETDLSDLDDPGLDGMVFTKEVEDPRRFGVVETDDAGRVTKLIEKPDSVENKTVLMGLYYFRDGEWLVRACKELMDRRIKTKGEYYLADAVTLMVQQGANFRTREVGVWMDTGKPETTLETQRYLLEHGHDNSFVAPRPGVAIIPPVFIHQDAIVERSVVGPYVSVEKGAQIRDSVLRDAIVDEDAVLDAVLLQSSLIGRWAKIRGEFRTLNMGDSSTMDFISNEEQD
ncbi:MAG: sugar phosphate nucleotidyltransferase [Anaerolineae bacterium]|nr:sugar phosphate nucleotidyltransferase [Anaerolineae bacterium]